MRTLAEPCRFEESIRRSRFVAHAAPVAGQPETLDFYRSVADPSATHNCWAWRIGGVYRFNDDGEPSGTAGRPILGVIEGRELDRVMVVVTRHFGGIKLGVGGVARAYSGCAAKCLDRATLVAVHRKLRFELRADFALADTVHRLLAEHGAAKLTEAYASDGLQMEVEVDDSRFGPLRHALSEASRGQVGISRPVAS